MNTLVPTERALAWTAEPPFRSGEEGTNRGRREQTFRLLSEDRLEPRMRGSIVGTSKALRGVLAAIDRVAPTDATVLITGETGTGKELVASAIHHASRRHRGPLIKVNCAAYPSELVASELFGHEKGAFTGALQQRIGRFEAAKGGTIFIDEIGDVSPQTQVALLRVLQEKEFERVGGTKTIRADARVIAATNRELQEEVAEGRFRMDLFYRLNVFPIRVPSLRERLEDVPALVEYFAACCAERIGKRIRKVDDRTLEAMQKYDWPGNVRELANVVERGVILADSEVLRLGFDVIPIEGDARGRGRSQEQRAEIEAMLRVTGGRISGPNGAAARLGVPPSTLESRIRALKIDKYRFYGRC